MWEWVNETGSLTLYHKILTFYNPEKEVFRKHCGKRRKCWELSIFPKTPLQKHVKKVVGGFGKKSCVSTGVRKPGNTYGSPTAMI